MKLNEIRPPKGATKKKRRVACGPGSGRGKTSGRGHKGQNSRSGGGVPPWFEGGQMPLQRRVPKRGFTNIFKTTYQVVNVGDLNRFDKGAKVTRGTLIEKGLVKKADVPVKILGKGKLEIALEIEADAASSAAVKAVMDAGGSISLGSGGKAKNVDSGERS